MHIIQYISLAIVQGVTEFLPVSSSGHLAILQKVFNFYRYTVSFDAILHLGTLIAVLVVFWPDIVKIFKNRDWKIVFWIALTTVPAAVFGYFFKDQIEQTFGSLRFVGAAFLFTAMALLFTVFFKKSDRNLSRFKILDSIIIGLSQALALFPGISRSGMTISAGLMRKLKPEESYRFSFLLSMPAILGALILQSNELVSGWSQNWLYWLIGLIVSFGVGVFCLKLLEKVLKKGKFAYFSIYLILLGGLILIFS